MNIPDLLSQDYDDFYGDCCQPCIVIPIADDARYCDTCADQICQWLEVATLEA